MKGRIRPFGIAVVAAVTLGVTSAFVFAADHDDQPLTGVAYDRAVEAALAETGGGEVVETEGAEDGAAYGVEVRTPDGAVVEVELDENFRTVDVQREEEDDGENDDA
jgi:uncharacterized membrane protein YkoI